MFTIFLSLGLDKINISCILSCKLKLPKTNNTFLTLVFTRYCSGKNNSGRRLDSTGSIIISMFAAQNTENYKGCYKWLVFRLLKYSKPVCSGDHAYK